MISTTQLAVFVVFQVIFEVLDRLES